MVQTLVVVGLLRKSIIFREEITFIAHKAEIEKMAKKTKQLHYKIYYKFCH
jgi:hypothetical protein